MEKSTRVRPSYLRHRCNSQREIDEALSAGFDGVEIDLIKGPRLCHEHGGQGPLLEEIDFRGCVVAVNIKEYGLLPYVATPGILSTARDHFFFDVPGPELDLYCLRGARVFGRFSQWENQTLMPQVEGALIDDFTGSSTGQGTLMLRTSLPVALISNQLRASKDAAWVVQAAKYVICKEKP